MARAFSSQRAARRAQQRIAGSAAAPRCVRSDPFDRAMHRRMPGPHSGQGGAGAGMRIGMTLIEGESRTTWRTDATSNRAAVGTCCANSKILQPHKRSSNSQHSASKHSTLLVRSTQQCLGRRGARKPGRPRTSPGVSRHVQTCFQLAASLPHGLLGIEGSSRHARTKIEKRVAPLKGCPYESLAVLSYVLCGFCLSYSANASFAMRKESTPAGTPQ